MLRDDIKRLARHSLKYSLARVSLTGVDLLLIPLYTRALNPTDYGAISVLTVFIGLLLLLFPVGQDAAVARYYFDYRHIPRELKSYLGTVVIFTLAFALLSVLLLSSVGHGLISLFVKGVALSYIRWAMWVAFLSLTFTIWLQLLRVREQSNQYVLYSLAQGIVKVLLVIQFLIITPEGLSGWVKATVLSALIFFVLSFSKLRSEIIWTVHFTKLYDSMKYGLPVMIHSLSGWLSAYANRFILIQFATLSTVGIYHIGYSLGSVLSLAVTSYNFAYAPFFMSMVSTRGEKASPIFARLATYFLMTIAALALVLSVFAKELVVLVASEAYQEAYRIVPIVAFTYVVTGMYYMIVNPIFYVKVVTKYLPLITVSGAGVNLLLNFLLIPQYQMMGAAWAGFISTCFVVVLAWPLSHRVYPIGFEYKRVFILFAITGCMLAAGLAVNTLAVSLWSAIAMKTAIILFYPVVLILIRMVRLPELTALWELCRPFISSMRA